MMSMWRVRTHPIAGTDFFEVYRLRDVCAPKEPRNIEVIGGLWPTPAEAERLAKKLNEEEGTK